MSDTRLPLRNEKKCRANEIAARLTDPLAKERWGTAQALCGCSRCTDRSPKCRCGRNQFEFYGCDNHPCFYGCAMEEAV